MAKFSRRDLKDVVKECLVEILQEGLSGDRQSSRITESISPAKYRHKDLSPKKRSLDNISWNKKSSQKNPNFEKNVDSITSQMTSDPILASVLADTAMTTLQEQVSAETGGMHSPVAARDGADLMMSQSDPIDIFGESAGKWAELAFADTIKR